LAFLRGCTVLAVAAGPHKLWLWVDVASAVVGPERWDKLWLQTQEQP